ncbi:hypothetical protein [Novipirellula maiorica]|uniref:hypothetical protein n=1 Tax=Novipirellula maiorica TaxID=1265734 RepID=UPI001360B4E8|nr:hypothetical protein [Rhodopirellula maiorica]
MNYQKKIDGTKTNIPFQAAFRTSEPQATENDPAPGEFNTSAIDRSKILISMDRSSRFDQRLRTFRVTLSILVSGCITLGAVVWWRLLH